MSRFKSLLLALIPVVLVFIIHITVIPRGVIGIQPFSQGYPGDIIAEQKEAEHNGKPPVSEGLKRYEAEGIERAWRDGSIRFEGGSGQSEDDPLVVRMDFPHRMHQFDMDHIIPIYLREHVPDSLFVNIVYDTSLHPLLAQYLDADGSKQTLWIDARYSLDWKRLIGSIVLSIGVFAGYLVYRTCRRRSA